MFSGPSSDWNQKKIKAIIEHYGHPFFVHKKVLDLGCGQGDIGGVLHRLGSDVTAVDARQDHLKMVAKKYAGVKTTKVDLDGAWPFYGKSFDVVVDIGVLCHLKNFEEHLRNVCASTTYLILETAVLDSDDPNTSIVQPDGKGSPDGSYNGFSSQVSANNIERVLKDCGMSFKRCDAAKFNAGSYVYDWQVSNTSIYSINKRRIWFCINERRNPDHVDSLKTQTIVPISPPTNIGVFSTSLANSKIPVLHKPMQITKSPAPPYSPGRGHAVGTVIPPRPGKIGNKVRLFYNYYEDKNPGKRQEIDTCLQKNMDNPLFDIIIVGADDDPTFDFMFQAINRLADDTDISIICNSDIFFDDSIKLALNVQAGQVYALSPWRYVRQNYTIFSNSSSLQNAWIVRGRINNVNANFQMGKSGSSARLAYEFKAAGYTVLNPSKSIKAYQYDQSGANHFYGTDGVLGPYLNIDPTALK